MSYNCSRRITPRSRLRDWNVHQLSSGHMALSILFTKAAPVTLRWRPHGILPSEDPSEGGVAGFNVCI